MAKFLAVLAGNEAEDPGAIGLELATPAAMMTVEEDEVPPPPSKGLSAPPVEHGVRVSEGLRPLRLWIEINVSHFCTHYHMHFCY